MAANAYVRGILGVHSFSNNVKKFFLEKLDHNLWTRDEVLEIFLSANLEAHMQVLKDLEGVPFHVDGEE